MVRSGTFKKNIILLLTIILVFPTMVGAQASLCHEIAKASKSSSTVLDQHKLHQHDYQHKTLDNSLDKSSSTYFTDHISNYCINALCVLPTLSNFLGDKYIQESPESHAFIFASIQLNIRKRPPKISYY